MDTRAIIARLGPGRFGRRIFQFTSIGSTNDQALADLDLGIARDGDVYVADEQTQGRGTNHRSWHSPPGAGLWLSLVLIGGSRARPLPFLPAVALADLLSWDCGLAAHLKWPNDVLVGPGKVAGILMEGRTGARGDPACVIGIGLNVGQTAFPPELDGIATSLALEGSRQLDRGFLLENLLRRMNALDTGGHDLVPAFRARCRMFGRRLRTAAGETFEALDLSPEGHLRLRDAVGRERSLVSRSDSEFQPGWLDDAPPYTPPPPLG
ncbi:MAG: biotin--[acetyl-CoA-carboxylase] ligase [Planctomycetes bacterium]|nr:biotin--[acetyl-CoA-carboxylase] ligase [Planctomycetota bacterium]